MLACVHRDMWALRKSFVSSQQMSSVRQKNVIEELQSDAKKNRKK
jgi:hypothetical protein